MPISSPTSAKCMRYFQKSKNYLLKITKQVEGENKVFHPLGFICFNEIYTSEKAKNH